jgi:hypothetical protein
LLYSFEDFSSIEVERALYQHPDAAPPDTAPSEETGEQCPARPGRAAMDTPG